MNQKIKLLVIMTLSLLVSNASFGYGADYFVVNGLAYALSDWNAKMYSTQRAANPPAANWYSVDFDDSSWTSLTGQPKFPVYQAFWIRRKVYIAGDPASYSFSLKIRHDDEAIAYVNGNEVYNRQDYTDEFRTIQIPASILHSGENLIAVYVYDSGGNRRYIDFDLTANEDYIVYNRLTSELSLWLSQVQASVYCVDDEKFNTVNISPLVSKNFAVIEDAFVTWTSSDVSVATVSDGEVHAVGAGTATITASVIVDGETVSAQCIVQSTAFAEGVKVVCLDEAGTLPSLITDAEKYTITDLAILGPLNGTDIRYIREMAGRDYDDYVTKGKLRSLDMKAAKIVSGGEKYRSGYGTVNATMNSYMFYQCQSLTSVTIPESVTSIGGYAFSGCSSLTSVTIPEGVTSIGERVFYGCSSLTSVTIPEGVTSIGVSAFYNCSSLTSVTIPEGVTSIGNDAFQGCSSLTSVTIPEGVTSIGSRAFQGCSSLMSVSIPSSVTSIQVAAFQDCSNVTNISVAKGNTIFDSRDNCNAIIETKTNSLIAGCVNSVIPSNVTSIGETAFDGCSRLKYLQIPEGVTSIGAYSFENCISLEILTLPSSLTVIGGSAFYGCKRLKFVVNNSSLYIQPGSYENGCVAYYATTVVKGQDVDTFGEDNGFSFYETGGKKYIYGYVGTSPHIIMPSGYEYVTGAFEGRADIVSVTLPSDMTNVPSRLFYDCQLMSLTVGSRVVSIGTDAFNKKPYKTIWLCNTPPSNYSLARGSINYVANNQFSALSNVKVYSSLSSMFTVDGVKYVMVSPSDRTCVAVDCEYNANAAHIHIGETVTYKNVTLKVLDVNNYACYKNPYIEDVLLVNNGNVGGYAFYDCDSIQSVTISNNGNVIGSAFYDCDGIQSVTISNNGNINTYAFYDCDGIRSADIQNKGLIDECAFYGCDALQTVELGDDITSIGYDAFYYCTKLGSIVIPDATTSLGSYCFAGCTSLTSVTTGSGLQTIGSYAFRDCSSLSQVTLKEGVQTIGTYSFQNCSSLSEITVPKSVTSIGNNAFRGCTALKDVTFADRTTALSLGSNGSDPMFSSCPLESVYIGGKITYSTSSSYGYSPFYRNTTLKSVTITDTETTIYPNEFYGCSALTDVSIGDGVTTIGNWAFSGCVSLTHFSFGRGMKTIGQEAFSDCTAMTTIVSQASVPPTCGSQALDDINKWECELFVPTGYADAYAAADQWKEFFFVEEKDVEETYSTILAAEYGTWIVPVDAEIPEGFTFYTCENFNGGSLELVEATSIEANVPYIIQGTAGDTCTVTGIYDMSDNLTYGCLTGVYEDTQVTSGYVLQDGEEGLGFYRVGSTAITLTANHCYLNVTGSSAPMLRLGDATAVDPMMVEEQDDVLYDLYGRKANEPNSAGIYIKNGKKVFVK